MAPYSINQGFATADLAVNTIGLTISFCVVVLRLWARCIRRVKWRLSDYTIIASWIFTFGLITSENFAIVHGGVGQDISNVTIEEIVFSQKQFIVIGATSSLAISLVKISILDFLLSIFATDDRFRVPAYVLMAITAGFGISFAVGSVAACTPFAANWDKVSYPDYKCINLSAFYSANTIIGAILDFCVLLLPIPFVWNLSLPTRKKVGLSFLFSLGTLICVISLVRLAYNLKQTYIATHFTEYAGIAVLLGSLEANLFIICACLPTLPTLAGPLSNGIKSILSSNNGGWRRLLTGFSSKTTQAMPRSAGGSSFTKLRDIEAHASEPVSRDAALESARLQRLYPMSVTMASRPSIEGDQAWSYQQAKSQTQIMSRDESNNTQEVEMTNIGEALELQSINVTKSWTVNGA